MNRKLSIDDLQKAQRLAGHRVHLEGERKKLGTAAPMTFANAKVVFQGATMKQPVTVEIEENKQGAIGKAILKCITDDIDNRIALLDEELAALGIEVAA